MEIKYIPATHINSNPMTNKKSSSIIIIFFDASKKAMY